jgi:hypothetical protein
VEAVRLETGFVYIKVVVVTAGKNCGERVKAQVRAFIALLNAVGNAAGGVGKYVQ